MKTTLLLARHGNTFRKGETVLRVGARSDLPLVESKLGTSLGEYLKHANLIPDVIYSAPLKRTMQTADQIVEAIKHLCAYPTLSSRRKPGSSTLMQQQNYIAKSDNNLDPGFRRDDTPSGSLLKELEYRVKIIPDSRLIEIDYGMDDGKPEEEVVARIGVEALDNWNKHAIVPSGWNVNPKAIIDMWHQIAQEAEKLHKGQKVLIVTSNGLLRFAPYITADFDAFSQTHDLKVATGGLCIFEKPFASKIWACTMWNFRPNLC